MYGCKSWTIKKAERQRIDVFELWCWRLLRVPWTSRRSNQSILKEISPECSLEGLMQKLKFQYFGHLMWRADSLEETLMLGKIEGRRRRGWRRMRWLDSIMNSMDMSLSRLPEKVRAAWWAAKRGCKESESTEQLKDIITLLLSARSSTAASPARSSLPSFPSRSFLTPPLLTPLSGPLGGRQHVLSPGPCVLGVVWAGTPPCGSHLCFSHPSGWQQQAC